MTLGFLNRFSKITQIPISWKSFQWDPSCSIRTDVRTDTMKLIVAFRNFENAGKMDLNSSGWVLTIINLKYGKSIFVILAMQGKNIFGYASMCFKCIIVSSVHEKSRFWSSAALS
jgi:hypothetical protein